MIMLYFSGTGNSKYIAELFCDNTNATCYSIEESNDFDKLIHLEDVIGFCYPVYMSRVPRIMREFVLKHMSSLKDKKVIILCTQLLLSGDGARSFAALFPKHYVDVIYAEHLFMPNNVNNVFILPGPSEKSIKRSIDKSKREISVICDNIKNEILIKRGFNYCSRALGLLQGVFLSQLEARANYSVKIDKSCTKCSVCVKACPTKNLELSDDLRITHNHNCTMCYRCINNCPKRAITVAFHGKVRWQYKGIH